MKKNLFDDLKVGRKLLISYGAIIILYLFTIIAALFGIFETSRTLDVFYTQAFQVSYTAMDMKASVQGIGRCILDVVTGVSPTVRQEKMDEIDSLVAVLNEGFPILEDGMAGEELIKELDSYIVDVNPIRMGIIEKLDAGEYREALNMFDNQYEPYVRKARVCLQQISDKALERAEHYLISGHAVKQKMNYVIMLLGLIVLAISTLLWLRITRGITEPVKELKDAAEELAAGNLDVSVSYRAKDELGGLADSVRETAKTLKSYVSELEHMLYAIGSGKLSYQSRVTYKGDFVALEKAMSQITLLLNRALLQISNTADQVASGSDQVSDGAQMMSQGAVEQAGAMKELAANINEIYDGIRNNADDAVKASGKVDEVSYMVANSSMQMDTMLRAIHEIRENSKTIGKIAKEIEDIAFQTNLLALNAAVEAARAGEEGRSFSVVAAEIRELSVKTTEASKMMAHLSFRTEETFAGGMEAADKAAKALEEVVEGTDQINAMVERISEASVHQADAVIQIRQSMEQVSEIVQGNSATAEEGAAASEELSAQAQNLKKLVEGFELS